MHILYGENMFRDKLLGMEFNISAYSFFQTNTKGAEILYSIVKDFVGDTKDKVVFDLYCGTGTIGIIVSENAKKVVGIELIEEAVEAAKENAAKNGVTNCEFIAGDVLKEVDALSDKPDVIVVDPPRKGCDEACLETMLKMQPKRIVYVSCDPATLARDLKILTEGGYELKRVRPCEMFPQTVHVETVALLSKLSEAKHHIEVKVDMDELDLTSAEAKATYKEIQDWVQEMYGFHVTNLNIAQVKQKHGIIERENYNKPKSPDSKQPGCTEEKVKAIEDAMRHFQMI